MHAGYVLQMEKSNDGAVDIPFTLSGRSGIVRASVLANRDGVWAGFDVLSGLPFPPDASVGYPVMAACVEYEGTGYRTLMAWVQTIRTVRTWATERVVDDRFEVDVAPAFHDLDLPFFALGSNPSVFDVPARNLNGADHLRWTADTFLTTLPLRSRREPIRPLASFRWGYTETALSDEEPVLLPLAITGRSAWTATVELLSGRFPGWVFGAA